MQQKEITAPGLEKVPDPALKVSNTLQFIKYHLGPLFLYLLGAIVFTWPLALHLDSQVINERATSADVWQHLWNAWWLRFSLLDLHTQPFHNPFVFWPGGADLYFHALDPLDGYISVPFQLIFGLVTAYNLVFFLQIALAGYGAYLLVRHLCRNSGAALAAGIIYAFSPLESAFINLGQVELSSIAWLPLFLYFFIKLLEGLKFVKLNFFAAVGFLVALSLDSWYYTFYALLLSGLYLLYRLWFERKTFRTGFLPLLTRFGAILLLWLLICAPILLPTLKGASSGGNSQSLWKIAYNGTSLFEFIQPGPSVFWNLFGIQNTLEARGNFIGLFTFGLALTGIIFCWQKTRFWCLAGLTFALLALGPVLHFSFNPDWNETTALQGLWLPGQLLYKLPFGDISRVPLRFGLGLTLGLAVCASFGIRLLAVKAERTRWFRKRSSLVPLAAGTLIFLEFLPGPRTLVNASIPAFYQQIRSEKDRNDFAVLEIPDSITSLSMYYQTAHEHPILNAYLSRRPPYPFEQEPGIRELRLLKQDILRRDILDLSKLRNVQGVLANNHIRYVIFHPSQSSGDEKEKAQSVLAAVFGDAQPFFEDSTLKVWRVPLIDQANPSLDRVLLTFGQGWGDRKTDSENQPYREASGKKAELNLYNPYSVPLPATISSNVRGAGKSTLQSRLNGKLLSSEKFENSNARKISFIVTLLPGSNLLSFEQGGVDGTSGIRFGHFDLQSSN